jgi:hypothetical protein
VQSNGRDISLADAFVDFRRNTKPADRSVDGYEKRQVEPELVAHRISERSLGRRRASRLSIQAGGALNTEEQSEVGVLILT